MNKVKLFLLIAIVAIMTSCQKEPSASFTSSKTLLKVGESVTFTNTTQDGDSYDWSFGDGQTSTASSPSHTYNAIGTYTVSMTAYSKNGKKKDVATATLTVIQTTDLALTVYIDGSSTTVDDCLIQIFTNQTDWDNYTNVVASGSTDINGNLTITDLQPMVYYIDAYRIGYSGSGYYCNWNLGYITNALVANTVNNYNIYVEYFAKDGGDKKLNIVKIQPVITGNEFDEKNIVSKKRKDNIDLQKGSNLKK